MSDIAKWALLIAGFVLIMTIVMSLPIMDALNPTMVVSSIGGFLSIAGDFLQSARGIINNFLTPAGVATLNICIYWVVGRAFLTWTLNLTLGAYRFIFK